MAGKMEKREPSPAEQWLRRRRRRLRWAAAHVVLFLIGAVCLFAANDFLPAEQQVPVLPLAAWGFLVLVHVGYATDFFGTHR